VSFSETRIGGWYFTVQGLAILAWWSYLTLVPSAERFFIPPGASEIELRAFQLPDLLAAAPTSVAGGVAILLGSRWAIPLAWATAGAMVYAFLYCVSWSLLRDGGWLNVAMMAPAALLSTVSALDVSSSTVAIFRRASPASAARHVLMTGGQIIVFWSFFLFVVPAFVSYVERRLPWPVTEFRPAQTAAVVLFVTCSILGLASGFTMASHGSGTPLPFVAPNRLVTSGPYAYVRNPMVIAGLGQGFAVGWWLGSGAVVAYVLLGGLIWQLLVRPAEERDLRDGFGEDYVRYCRDVQCWVPRGRPLA
jgi:protein-S-isoprenylcysteine O-methyltransferase Ste14